MIKGGQLGHVSDSKKAAMLSKVGNVSLGYHLPNDLLEKWDRRKRLRDIQAVPHFQTEENGMVSIVLPGLRDAVDQIEKKIIER